MKKPVQKPPKYQTDEREHVSNKMNQTDKLVDTSGEKLGKFSALISRKHRQFLKDGLFKYYGKNFAINYKQDYAFDQQWQGCNHSDQHEQQYISQNQSLLHMVLLFTIMISNTLMIWMNTIQTFFMDQNTSFDNPLLFILAIFCQVVYMVLQASLMKRGIDQKVSLCKILLKSYPNIMLVKGDHFLPQSLWLLLQIICIFIMYRRAKKIYKSFRLKDFVLVYQYQFKIVDIILNLMIIAHFIAIILYQVTKLEFENTWISSAGIEGQSAMIKYFYSFYFCCTTILTVGYGDISPKNYAEVVVVTLVEIFGIIAFANFINEIGHSLTEIRKKNENVEKELLVIQKMKKWYKMNDELSKRARIHVINNKAMDTQLSPSEENGVLVKLSEQLRNQIQGVNSLKIVKSQIFFLLRWSNSFQKAISLRLCSIMFPPGQLLYQPQGKERIYILRQGKIDIYASKRGAKRGINTKVLKTIESNLNKEVSNNAYGYTAVVSRRPVQLYAVAKRHTSGYYIEKGKFLQCIHERPTDFQLYHELKNRIDESPCWESIQVPNLDNSRYHYNPTHANLFRRNNRRITPQNRSFFERNQKRRMSVSISNLAGGYIFVKSTQIAQEESISETTFSQLRPLKETSLMNNQKQLCLSSKCRNMSHLHHHFESSKQYSHYLPKNNRLKVLKKYDIELGEIKKSQKQYIHSSFYDALKEYRNTLLQSIQV